MSAIFGVLNPLKNWKAGDPPLDASISLMLNEHGTQNGVVTISASLATDAEIDYAIDRLKEDLERLRQEAKRTIGAQRNKIIESTRR